MTDEIDEINDKYPPPSGATIQRAAMIWELAKRSRWPLGTHVCRCQACGNEHVK